LSSALFPPNNPHKGAGVRPAAPGIHPRNIVFLIFEIYATLITFSLKQAARRRGGAQAWTKQGRLSGRDG